MKSFKKNIASSIVSIATLVAAMLGGLSATAHAAQVPYVPGGTPTTTTPRFNMYSGVPGIGDESDFVRLRASNGDPKASATANVYVDPLSAACNIGDKFDIRSYVHNGADPSYNNNGTGTAVATNVRVSLNAPFNVSNNKFTFGSTISADNAASVSDTGTLNCGNTVQLQMVSGTAMAYSTTLGWITLPDSAVNGSALISSHVLGSDGVWSCWEERVMVVYTVKVVEVPTPPAPIYSCDLLTNTGKIAENKYGFKVDYTAKNGATFKNVSYVYSDGTTTSKEGATTEHLFTNNDATKKVTATVFFTVNGEEKSNTSAKCAIEFTKTTPPTPPTVLPNTGAGSTIAIFGATSVIGAFLYRLRALRSLR